MNCDVDCNVNCDVDCNVKCNMDCDVKCNMDCNVELHLHSQKNASPLYACGVWLYGLSAVRAVIIPSLFPQRVSTLV